MWVMLYYGMGYLLYTLHTTYISLHRATLLANSNPPYNSTYHTDNHIPVDPSLLTRAVRIQ